MTRVFLSASIPIPGRNPEFTATADVLLIREAIKAMVVALIESDGRLIFGGHPAITPLIAMLFDDFGFDPRQYVTLYQSGYFAGVFPLENERFGKIVRTPSVAGDREQSLFEMRRRMLTDVPLDLGVFVGGMEGVLDEFDMFTDAYGVQNAISLSSTGAAARLIAREIPEVSRELGDELTYLSLFRSEFSNRKRG